MARIVKPTIDIGGTEFKCKSRSVDFAPGEWINFCEREWVVSIDIEIAYGTGESWTVLNGFQDTVQTVVIRPDDGTIGLTNPSATFDAVIPPVPFMSGATRGDRQVFTLELTAEAEPVYATS